MRPDQIRKNKRLTHFSALKDIVIKYNVTKMPKNKKPKEHNRDISEFFSSYGVESQDNV